MRVESICVYDMNASLTTMQVEDMGDCFRFHIVTENGNKTIDVAKNDVKILESFLRNRHEIPKVVH